MGLISPVGLDVKTGWENLVAGRSGIRRITRFDVSGDEWRVKIAGEAWGFDPLDHLSAKDVRRADRTTQMTLAAAEEARSQARLEIGPANADDVGVIIGCGSGGVETYSANQHLLDAKGPRGMHPLLIIMEVSDASSVQVAIRYGLHGTSLGLSTACATGSDAIGIAAETIRRGDAEVMFAGGTEAAIHPMGIGGFDNLGALSRRNDTPAQASRPFELTRDGFVVSEGAAVLILESLEHAARRGAEPLAELAAYGATSDGQHLTAPDENGTMQGRAVRRTLEKAGLRPDEIGYINAHATGTQVGDPLEVRAYRQIFGDRLPPLSSTKSVTGHLLGAAGAIEAIWSIQTIRTGCLPPTINYEQPDPACLADVVPNAARLASVDAVLSAAFGFGGHNSVLAFRRAS